MSKKNLLIFIILFSILAVLSVFYYYGMVKVKPHQISTQVLGNETMGTVVKEGVYGNPESHVKIAYIVGVHPLESNAHQAIVQSIKSREESLKYGYYIYTVNVTQDAQGYERGRMNGQLLASEYLIPEIKDQHFNLVVDVHSNEGNYKETRFLYVPVKGTTAESIARNITIKIPWMVTYSPPNPTSPEYVTIPIIQSGTPAMIYETYLYESYEVTKEHAGELVNAIDNVDFG
jgi:hypothetical protein